MAHPLPLGDKTRVMKAPSDWDEKEHGPCMDLEIHDGVIDGNPVMVSAWQLTDGEIAAINNGAPLYLRIHGTGHPVVSVFAGDPPKAN